MLLNSLIKKTVSFSSFFCLLFIGIFPIQSASSAVQFPKCGKILQWAASGWDQDSRISGGAYMNGKYFLSGLSDELLKPTFGKTYDQWSQDDINKFSTLSINCLKSSRLAARNASKQRKYDQVKFYNNAGGYLSNVLGVTRPGNRSNSYFALMKHQKGLYPEFKKAQALKKSQLSEISAMAANRDNVNRIAKMALDPQFAYLRPNDKNNHVIILRNNGIKLTDKMVDDAITKFNDFPETMSGLQELQTHRQKFQKDMAGLRSTKWKVFDQRFMSRSIAIAGQAMNEAIDGLGDFQDDLDGLRKLTAYRETVRKSMEQVRSARWAEFEKAYTDALNASATGAIEGFEEELNALPATVVNLQAVRNSVSALFKYRPVPVNIQSYREIADARARTMQQDIQKIACYKSLDSVGLDEDYRDVPILGYNGETSLGLFVCAMTKRGYKFQEYEDAGWFSSTHTLSILNQRGITLTIELEEVEAVKGKEMLVGVMAKDASSETPLTLTGWQDYAQRLTGARRSRLY